MNRRNFMQNAMAGALASAASSQAAPPESKMIGIQVGAVSFVDEGVNKVLDVFQQSANVNTLFVATFTYGRGIAGRQVPGQPLPDHGQQEYDTNFHGGKHARPQGKEHTPTSPKKIEAPDHPGFDCVPGVFSPAPTGAVK